MVTTVTTSTVSSIAAAAIVGSLALVGILVLLALLIQKELFLANPGGRSQVYSRVLNIAITPLMIAFLLLVAIKVAEVLK